MRLKIKNFFLLLVKRAVESLSNDSCNSFLKNYNALTKKLSFFLLQHHFSEEITFTNKRFYNYLLWNCYSVIEVKVEKS